MVSQRVLAVARGDEPADLVLTGGRVLNVFTGELETADIAFADGLIAGVGSNYAGPTIHVEGSIVAPGYIDAHVHIESSLCTPPEFARAVLPRGVTAVVTDPHEIANVAGLAGVEWMIHASRDLPLEVLVMAPSCVPASPLARGGAELTAPEIRTLRDSGNILGLAEVMNFPGVIAGDAAVHAKLAAMAGLPIDGHAPGVRGHALNAYVAAGIGSDHECTTAEEAKEKLSRGLYLLIREATNARNLDELIKVITPQNARRICFCTDDRTPGDLLTEGSIDHMVRRAIALGVPPVEAIRMATLNTAEWFRLPHLGAIAPGRLANLQVFDDLNSPAARLVFARGELVARDGQMLPDVEFPDLQPEPLGACHLSPDAVNLAIPATGSKIRVIGARPDQLVTDALQLTPTLRGREAIADPARDLLKMAVLYRHSPDGPMGLGFLKGFGLQRGAIAGTVAHDHHNLVVIGADDVSMRSALKAISLMGGGLAVTEGDKVLAALPLEVGGLMSLSPIEQVADEYRACVSAARSLGSTLADPFMAMSFMALEVIPSLKLTADGLVDVEQFKHVSLFV